MHSILRAALDCLAKETTRETNVAEFVRISEEAGTA
jgi:hypothetical protein